MSALNATHASLTAMDVNGLRTRFDRPTFPITLFWHTDGGRRSGRGRILDTRQPSLALATS
jgi:hypothetical protein